MASRRASLTSFAVERLVASIPCLVFEPVCWDSLHSGQWVAKPGLPGFSSNSSPQIAQVLTGNTITQNDTTKQADCA